MLQPKRTKFRKQQKGRVRGNATRGAVLAFGSFGLKSIETKYITAKQLEAAKRVNTASPKYQTKD